MLYRLPNNDCKIVTFYLVTKLTAKGMEKVKKEQEEKIYGTRNKLYWIPEIWSHTSLVTSEIFENREPIRAWFKKHRANFCGGKCTDWNSWLNGADSSWKTLNEDETHEFWFMECEEFETLDAEWRKSQGLTPQIPATRV